MQEQLNDRVSVVKRTQELLHIVNCECSLSQFSDGSWTPPDGDELDDIDPLVQYIARLVENAYLAGIHQVTCNREPKYEDNLGIGPHLVRARSYVKDKGLIP